MKFLIFALLSFLAVVEVWSSLLKCWHAEYYKCLDKSTLDEIYNCVKDNEKRFIQSECGLYDYKSEKCVLLVGTFADESEMEIRFCGGPDDDCKEVHGNVTRHSKAKPLKKLQCTTCYEDLCNEPAYILKGLQSPHEAKAQAQAMEKKPKNGN